MADDRNPNDQDALLDPEDVNSQPAADGASPREPREPDPNDEIPVPVAMSPAEVDERAQAVEALREQSPSRPLDDSTGAT